MLNAQLADASVIPARAFAPCRRILNERKAAAVEGSPATAQPSWPGSAARVRLESATLPRSHLFPAAHGGSAFPLGRNAHPSRRQIEGPARWAAAHVAWEAHGRRLGCRGAGGDVGARGQGRAEDGGTLAASASAVGAVHNEEGGQPPAALLLEVEGVMVDLHRSGHLEAFNAVFASLGFNSRWNSSTYNLLHRRTGGASKQMLNIFFDQFHWPMADLDPAGKDALLSRVLRMKDQALLEAVESQQIPLRPGVVQFLEEAVSGGMRVAALASEARCGEAAAKALLARLPEQLGEMLVVVGKEEVRSSAYWQVAMGVRSRDDEVDSDDSLAAQLSEAVAARKQMVAEQVAKALKVVAELDTPGPKGAQGVAALRAACELLSVPLDRVVVLAGSLPLLNAACSAGLPCVVVRSSTTAQAEFPGALMSYEDLGPGSLTVSRLRRRLCFD